MTAFLKGKERTETAGNISEALTWVEEFQFFGATEISVTDQARTYPLSELVGLVQGLRRKLGSD